MGPDEPQMAQMLRDDRRVRDPRTYAVIGAAMHVHNALGHGFLERVYQEALAIEFEERGIQFSREVDVPVHYAGQLLPTRYRADFVAFGNLLLELKGQRALTPADDAQVLHYLRATGMELGLLINFGAPRLEFRRFAWSWEDGTSLSSASSAAPIVA